jgi:hypothetical protein
MTDETRRWPMSVEEAAQAQREAADRLAEAPDEYAGWLVCQAAQFPPPRRPHAPGRGGALVSCVGLSTDANSSLPVSTDHRLGQLSMQTQDTRTVF